MMLRENTLLLKINKKKLNFFATFSDLNMLLIFLVDLYQNLSNHGKST